MPCTYVFYIRLSSSSIDMTQKIKHLHSISCSPLPLLLIQKIKPSRLSWRIRWGQWKLENAHQWYLRLLLVFLQNDNSIFLFVKITQQVQWFLRTRQQNSALHGKLCYCYMTWLSFVTFCHRPPLSCQRTKADESRPFRLSSCDMLKRLRDQPFSAGQRKASIKENFFQGSR